MVIIPSLWVKKHVHPKEDFVFAWKWCPSLTLGCAGVVPFDPGGCSHWLSELTQSLVFWKGIFFSLNLGKPPAMAELLWWLRGKEITFPCRRRGFDPWVRKITWRRKWQPTLVFLPGKSQGQRSLAGYSPWGHKRVGHDLVTRRHQNVAHAVWCPARRKGSINVSSHY